MVDRNNLYHKLTSAPAFLFLGQEYLSLETGIDPFLSEIIRKYGEGNTETSGYSQILGNEASRSVESALAWMQNRSKVFSFPVWLELVASFAWSGLYTTAIDVIWQKAFKASWREFDFIFTEEKDPLDARNRTKLHCTCLYGSVDQAHSDQRPPLTRLEMKRRHQIAIGLLRRLPRLVTPFGNLLIDGYSLENDWLSWDHFSVILDEMNVGQVHLFHANEKISNDPDIQALVASGKLTLYPEALAHFLRQGTDILQLGRQPEEENEGHQIDINERPVTVPLSLWNQLSRSAIVIENSLFGPPSNTSDERRYTDFRSFLARSGERPVWSGYVSGFAFKRDFEDILFKEVISSLEDKRLTEEPIILHGQSGIGKTVALGALAYRIKLGKRYPVLFIERRPLKPSYIDIDVFIEWVEHEGDATPLIIWDGMLEYDQYLDILRYLNGRGRKVTLVGSMYRQYVDNEQVEVKPRNRKYRGDRLIEAKSELSNIEIEQFEKYITEFVPDIGGIKQLLQEYGASFFVALYRLLPSTRSQLKMAINIEATYSEERIKNLAEEMKNMANPDESLFKSPLAIALAQAGFVSSEPIFLNEEEKIGGEYFDKIQKLIGLIMVPGRFGLRVPIDLLMRVIRNNDAIDLVNILSKIDLFSWSTDEVGNISIGPRHALEADLISKTRLGGPKYEIDFIADIIKHIVQNDTELQFIIELIRKVNPPDEEVTYNPYGPHLLIIANALTYIREQRSILSARLMLQETNLLREASKSSLDDSEEQKLLDRAEAVVASALIFAEREYLNPGLRSQLLVELAATLGSRAKQQYSIDVKSATNLYLQLRQNLFEARATSRDNFYPLDVLFWTTQDLIRADNVDLATRLDAQAELKNIFEMAYLEETFVGQERFHKRRQQLGQLLKDEKISEEAFIALDKQGSTAGYVLRAMQLAGEISLERVPNEVELKRILNASEFLQENRGKITKDGRAMQLLLRYWWIAKSGNPIFWSERQTVPFSVADWDFCLGILSDILRSEEVYRAPIIKYLMGLTLFHLSSIESAETFFKELERDSTIGGRRRILRSYLMSTPDGSPRKFYGTIDWLNFRDNRGEIYIPDLRKRIAFIPTDFRISNIGKGSTINDFHIAFNFLGFIADPPNFWKYAKRQEKT